MISLSSKPIPNVAENWFGTSAPSRMLMVTLMFIRCSHLLMRCTSSAHSRATVTSRSRTTGTRRSRATATSRSRATVTSRSRATVTSRSRATVTSRSRTTGTRRSLSQIGMLEGCMGLHIFDLSLDQAWNADLCPDLDVSGNYLGVISPFRGNAIQLYFVVYGGMKITVMWYYAVGAVVLGVFVAYAAMFGFDKFKELYDRLNAIKGNVK